MLRSDIDLLLCATGISQTELKNALDISTTQVADWVQGRRPIPKKYILSISKILNWDISKPLEVNEKVVILENILSKSLGVEVNISTHKS